MSWEEICSTCLRWGSISFSELMSVHKTYGQSDKILAPYSKLYSWKNEFRLEE